MSYIGRGLDKISNIEKLDAITFDGSQSYSLTKSSVAFTPNSANSLIISINGVCQFGNVTVSGTSVDFGVAMPSTDTNDFILHLGVGVVNTPADATVTNAKLAQDIISGETALTVPPATTDEFLVSDAGTLKRIDFSLLGNTPAFKAKNASNQAFSNTTWTKVTLGTEIIDTDSAFASDKFTVPANQAGKYFISCQISISATNDWRFLWGAVYKNGSIEDTLKTKIGFNSDLLNDGESVLSINGILDLSASDYIEAYGRIYDTSGDATNTFPSGSCVLQGFKLIGTQ